MRSSKHYEELLEVAAKKINAADHLIYITYPLIKEERLFIKILEVLEEALRKGISAAVQYELYWKNIDISTNIASEYAIFKSRRNFFSIDKDELRMMDELFSLLEKHRRAPVEFVRQKKFVILEDNLEAAKISAEKVKEYVFKSKSIVKKIEKRLRNEAHRSRI